MTKKKIMIPIMSIMLVTSSMTAIPSLTSVYAQIIKEARKKSQFQIRSMELKLNPFKMDLAKIQN